MQVNSVVRYSKIKEANASVRMASYQSLSGRHYNRTISGGRPEVLDLVPNFALVLSLRFTVNVYLRLIFVWSENR